MSTTTTTPTTTRQPGPESEELRLLSVLESGLPPELGTAHEPPTYTVAIVFSRQVTREEKARIEAPETARRLAAESGADPSLRLAVSDRRLLVEHTTLDQLRDGLATALAATMREIGTELRAERTARAADAEVRSVEERRRSSAVHDAVSSIRFE